MRIANKEKSLTPKQKKIAGIGCIVLLIAFMGAVAVLVGKPMIRFVSQPERFRAWVTEQGVRGKIIFVGMVIFQMIIAVVPGEPIEIGAGYAFGAFNGTVLCLIGNIIGGMMIFALVRTVGMRLLEVFFTEEQIHSVKFLKNTKRLNIITFVLFFLPGTPKDLLSYFVGVTEMKWHTWLLINSIARLPSIITSTVGGNALGKREYLFAVIVFCATLIVSLIGLLLYQLITAKHRDTSESKRENK